MAWRERTGVGLCVVALPTAGLSLLLGRLGLTSPTTLAGVLVGLSVALRRPGSVGVGRRLATTAQSVVGVVLGSTLDAQSVAALSPEWFPVAAAIGLMVALSLGVAVAMQHATGLDPPTATLAAVPGGALGIVAMARDLGGDERLIAFSQYLRVLAILLMTPLIASGPLSGGRAVHPVSDAGPVHGVAVRAGLVLTFAFAGLVLGRRLKLPAPSLLGPLVVTSATSMLFPWATVSVPAPLREAAFGLIGLDVGLRFTACAIQRMRQLLWAFIGALIVLFAGCFGVAVLLAASTRMTLLDAYLATTPGSLAVVGAVGFSTGADTALVIAVQALRMVVMLLIAPTAVRLTVRALERLGGQAR